MKFTPKGGHVEVHASREGSDIQSYVKDTDGYALIRRIRALPPGAGGSTPAMALTAYARSEDAQRALAAGFQRFVSKPVGPGELAGVIAVLGGVVRP